MLTKSAVDRALPRSAPFVLWDDELGGFGCRVFPSGKRSFVVQCRPPGSRKSIRLTLGTYGLLTVTEARAQARETLAKIRLGADPRAAKRARQVAEAAQASVLTVAALVDQYSAALLAGTAATKRLRGRQASPGYLEDTELHLKRFAAAHGRQAADAITRADLVRLLNGYVAQPSPHARRDQPHVCVGTTA